MLHSKQVAVSWYRSIWNVRRAPATRAHSKLIRKREASWWRDFYILMFLTQCYVGSAEQRSLDRVQGSYHNRLACQMPEPYPRMPSLLDAGSDA